MTILIALLVIALVFMAFLFGFGFGGAYYIQKIRSGRVEISGRIYHCKDTGPVVRD